MATASSCASGKFPDAHYSLSKERSIPPCSVWCARAFSRQAGESRITIVAPSFTNSPRKDASVCARKRMAGTGWLPRLHRRWRRALRKHESNSDSRLSNFETVMTAYVRSLAARFVRRRQTERELEEELGSQERFREECREAIAGNFLDILMQDLRFSLRTLARQPVFAVVAIVTLAIGIGMTTAMLSIVHDVLIRPLPYANSERLYAIYARSDSAGQPRIAASGPDYLDYREQNKSFVHIAEYLPRFTFTWTGEG